LKKESFTLIELLVVVAIIAVLVAILLPSIQQARDHANQVACASGFRQIITAVFQYADTNAEVGPGVGQSNQYLLDSTQTAPTSGTVLHRDLLSYLKNNSVFRCPADRYYWHNATVAWGFLWTSYGHALLGPNMQPTAKWSPYRLPLPNEAQLEEPWRQPFGADASWENIYPGQVQTHRLGFNAVFLDGHTKWYPAILEGHSWFQGRYRHDW